MEKLFEKYLQKINFTSTDFVKGIMNEIKWSARFSKGVFQIFEIKPRVLSILFWQEPQFLTSYYFS